jgi:uncharacterized cupredoxin-like copper-binding protein
MRKTTLLTCALGAACLTLVSHSTAAQLPAVVNVVASDYKFDAPTTVPAGTITFRMENRGKEVHHLWLVQLKGGKTYDDFLKAVDKWDSGQMPEWAVDVGGPNEASPGVNADATITLEPGNYAMVCYVPSPDGRPHVMRGMVKPLSVTAAGATKPNEPKADVTIKMTDYAFELSKPITAGLRVVRVENTAKQSHEVIVGKLLPGKTMKEALTWLNNGQKGSAPVIAVGGASGLANSKHQIITVTFEPGRYVLLCFIPDAKDLKPHTDHGMAKEITVAGVSTKK